MAVRKKATGGRKPRKATATKTTATKVRKPRKATATAPAKRRGRPAKATATATAPATKVRKVRKPRPMATATATAPAKKTARKLTVGDCGGKLVSSRLVGGYGLKKRVRKPKMAGSTRRRRRTSK